MGKVTGIQWTDATWNPIRGCSKVSDGCRNCYAESVANRFSGPGLAYEGLVHLRKGDGKALGWNGQIAFVEKHLLDPLRWKPVFVKCEACGVTQYQCLCEKFNHRPRRIFVNSMSDLFHENVTDAMRDRIFAVMALCPQHTFQVLTKRPGRMLTYLSDAGVWARIVVQMEWFAAMNRAAQAALIPALVTGFPLPHVCQGVSVEDQETAGARIPLLLQTPAWHHFISAEPLLGGLILRSEWLDVYSIEVKMDANLYDSLGETGRQSYIRKLQIEETHAGFNHLDWVICGGESGPGARPMHPDWARGLRDQCVAAGVPFFFKQWGQWMHGSDFRDSARIVLNDGRVLEGTDVEELSADDRNRWPRFNAQMMAPVGAKAAGDLLDGKQWHQFPEVR